MINSNIEMTLENEYLKKFILNNYDSKSISIAYGSFYTVNCYFSIGKKIIENGNLKYSFFLHNANGNNIIDVENYKDDKKLKECLILVGLEKKAETTPKKNNYTQLSIFDFM